ncbi:TPA: hypothetical protein ACGW7B_005511 [Bacillus nitratireducens]
MKKILIGMAITLCISVVANVWLYAWLNGSESHNEALERENKDLKTELEAKTNNTEKKVTGIAKDFTKAMFTWENGKGIGKIDSYVTDEAKAKLMPLGSGQEKEVKANVTSKMNKVDVYYSPVKSDRATVVTRVYRTMDVEGIASENSILLELEMVYKKGWLVDNAKILTEIKGS